MDFRASFDPSSLAELTRLAGFEALLLPEIQAALTGAGQLVVQTAQDISWAQFQNPTGAFADSLYFWVISPEEVAVGSDHPAAQRLEYGFSGMTDALGRFFSYWPDYHWAQQTVDQTAPEVEALVAAATSSALGRVVTG